MIMGSTNKYCIVGAGPGGLCLARAFKRAGLDFDIIERHSDVGGLWDIDNPGSPMYDSAHFISSKTQSAFLGYPMPEDYPDYPSHRQILAYVQSFAEHYQLKQHVSFKTEVTSARYENGKWLVQTSDGRERQYKGLICASGVNWQPSVPDFPGEFSGEIRHSVSYRSASEFKGKRVLIIGAGNSGCDIACDAASQADAAFISMRRGYHFVPKHIFGMPSDVFDAQGPQLPMWLKQRVFPLLLKMIIGDPSRYGLPKPDHRIFESHPIMNTQLLHHLGHGDIKAKGDIKRFDGDSVVFADGSREKIDLVLLATGYKSHVPYLDKQYLNYKQDRPDFYLNLFSYEWHNLVTMGFMETNSGAYKLFDYMAHTIACYFSAQTNEPTKAMRFADMIKTDRPDLSGGVHYLNSARHANYINKDSYKQYLERVWKNMGWPGVSADTFKDSTSDASPEGAHYEQA